MRLRELLATLVGLSRRRLQEILEDEQDDGGEPDGADADLLVAEGDARGEQARGELRRQDGEEDGAERWPWHECRAGRLQERGDKREVEEVRDHEDEKHERREVQRVTRRPARLLPPTHSHDRRRR